MSELIEKYFKDLSDRQKEMFDALQSLYEDWNSKINVVSRKDIDQLMLHHVLHSLAIAKFMKFRPGTEVIDVGTGGGFPGIPLAIMYPDARFTLIDSIGKKIKVVEGVATSLGLDNVEWRQARSEEVRGKKYDYVVCRAVTAMPDFVKMTRHLVGGECKNALPNGIVCLKGGDLREEVKSFGRAVTICDVSDYFDEEYFEGKHIVHLSL